MRRYAYASGVVAAILASAWTLPALAGSPGAGESAPVLAPTEWLNSQGTLDWDTLKGKVILIEKWATW
jgi:hypothetical protein